MALAVPHRTSPLITLVVIGVVVVAVLALAPTARGQSTVTRLDAGTPVEAGIAVSRAVFADGAADHVVLVRDDVFADALVAGPLTGELPGLAPILLTPGDALDGAVADELDRVTGGGGMVHVVGGTAAIGTGVVEALEAAGHTVQRIAGPTRVDTALAVFDTFFAADLAGGDVMVARAFGSDASGHDAWPDAITGGGFGAARGVPILLSPTDGLPAAVATALGDAGAAIVLGGTAAIGQAVEDALAEVVDEVVRTGGPTREATGVAVARDLFGIPALEARDVAVLVNGRSSFAFGLAAATLSAAGNGAGEAPILLVDRDSPVGGCDAEEAVGTPTACYLSAEGNQAGSIVLVGDETQISGEVEAAVAGMRDGDAPAGGGAGDEAGGDVLGLGDLPLIGDLLTGP